MNGYLTLIICIICIIVGYIAYKFWDKDKINDKIAAAIVIVAFIVTSISLLLYDDAQFEKELEAEQNKIDAHWNDIDTKAETYKIMLDGQEVDKDNINIRMYSVTVDDEKETIYITHKYYNYY